MKHRKKKCSCQDYYVTDLHPPGSASNIQIELPQRILIRPKINYVKVVFFVILTIVCTLGIFFGCDAIQKGLIAQNYINNEYNHTIVSIIIAIVCLLIFIFVVRKAILIWFIHLYQRYASDDVRLRCVYTPSCSEYMILSIEKYGVIKGIRKGIDRLHRCHLPNGGEDYP